MIRGPGDAVPIGSSLQRRRCGHRNRLWRAQVRQFRQQRRDAADPELMRLVQDRDLVLAVQLIYPLPLARQADELRARERRLRSLHSLLARGLKAWEFWSSVAAFRSSWLSNSSAASAFCSGRSLSHGSSNFEPSKATN